MKKSIYPIFVLIFSMSFSISAQKTDLQKSFLKGKVKSLEETEWRVKEDNGSINKQEATTRTIELFNEKGYKTDHIYFNDFTSDFRFGGKLAYSYNDYDQLVESKQYGKDSLLQSTEHYYYNDKGWLIEVKYFFPDTVQSGSLLCLYDSNGNKVETKSYGKKLGTEPWMRETYKYDELGNKTEYCSYEAGRLSAKVSYTYTSDGFKKERIGYSTVNKPESRRIQTYNSDGNIIEESYGMPELIWTRTYHYLFDERGNWITRVTEIEGLAIFLCEREIGYFE